MRELKIYARREFFTDGVGLFIAEKIDGQIYIARPPVMELLPEGQASSETTLNLPTESAQRLMDELWNVGLRPSEGSGSAGAMRAAENHIKDLQTTLSRSMGMTEKLIEK